MTMTTMMACNAKWNIKKALYINVFRRNVRFPVMVSPSHLHFRLDACKCTTPQSPPRVHRIRPVIQTGFYIYFLCSSHQLKLIATNYFHQPIVHQTILFSPKNKKQKRKKKKWNKTLKPLPTKRLVLFSSIRMQPRPSSKKYPKISVLISILEARHLFPVGTINCSWVATTMLRRERRRRTRRKSCNDTNNAMLFLSFSLSF